MNSITHTASVLSWTLLAGIQLALTCSGEGAKLYWTDRGAGKVQRSNLDGSEVETLVAFPAGSNLRGISVDTEGGRIYFADNGSGKILRVDLDGENQEELVSGLGFPADVLFDVASQKLYWCDQTRDRLQRANPDGSGLETLHEPNAPYFLDIDGENQRLYWGLFTQTPARDQPNVFRIDLPSGREMPVVSGLHQVRGVKLDLVDARLYWCDREAHKIQRARLDGSEMEDVVAGLDTPHGMVLDPLARMAYWADTGTNNVSGSTGGGAVSRSDMDGGKPIEVLVDLSQPWDADLDLRTRSYAEWRTRFFLRDLPDQLQEATIDADGDDRNNLLEYALATHPMRSRERRNPYTVSLRPANGGRTGVLEFIRFQQTEDLEYRMEVSSDLKRWSHNEDGAGQVYTSDPEVTPLPEGLEKVRIETAAPIAQGDQLYLRLRVLLETGG